MGLLIRIVFLLIYYVIYPAKGLLDLETQVCVKYGHDITQIVKPIDSNAPSFEELVKKSVMWVDKSLLIHRIVTKPEKFIIIICPRRWGKSINLSMLKSFYDIPVDQEGVLIDVKKTFSYNYFTKGEVVFRDHPSRNTDNFPLIAAHTDLINQFLGKHPVLYVDFSRFDANYWFSEIKIIMQQVYARYSYVEKMWRNIEANDSLTNEEKFNTRVHSSHFMKIACGKSNSIEEMSDSISFLLKMLNQFHGKTVVVCIDEFEAYANSLYFDEQPVPKEKGIKVKAFFREVMDKTFKNTDLIEKAILTGFSKFERESYLKISKYDVEEYSALDMKDLFPFYALSLDEVHKLMGKRSINERLTKMALLCYGGYYSMGFPNKPLFNTLSIVNFVNERKIDGFWAKSFVGSSYVFKLLKYKQFMKTILSMGEGDTYSIEYQRLAEIDFNECENLRKKISSFDEQKVPTVTEKQIDLALTSLFMEGYFALKNQDHLQLSGDPKQLIEIKLPNIEIKEQLNNIIDAECRLQIETISPGFHENLRKCVHSLGRFLTDDGMDAGANLSQTVSRLFTDIGSFSKLRKNCEHSSLILFMPNNHELVRSIHRWFEKVLSEIREFGYLSSVKYEFSFHKNHRATNKIDLFVYKDRRAVAMYFTYDDDINVERTMLRAINGTTYVKLCRSITFDVIKYLVVAVHGDGQVMLRWARKTTEDIQSFLHLMEQRVYHKLNGTSFYDYLQKMEISHANTTLVRTLDSLQLMAYYPLFKAYHVNFECFQKLTEIDFENIGVDDPAARKKMCDKIWEWYPSDNCT